MNYKSMLKGALALSLGLIVGSASAATTTTSDVQLYGATFESTPDGVNNDFAYGLGTNITSYTKTVAGETFGWLGAAEDESKIIAANGGQVLQLNTDAGTLTNLLASGVASDVNDGIAAAGAYIETEAKFVASDTLDAGVRGGTDNTKFAIYAYADENANPCTTNLVVYHGIMDSRGAITYTNEVFDTIVNTEVYTKIRVEMKQLEDPQSPGDIYNVFSVKIGNNNALSSDLALDALFNGAETGTWFLTVENQRDELGKLLSSVNFKGTGEVDNLAVGTITSTTTYAIDWTGSANVVVSNGTEEVSGTTGSYEADTVLTFYATVGLITNANNVALDPAAASWTYTVGTADATFTVLAGEQAAPPAPTVITVAQTVGAHGGSISNGNFQAMSGTEVPITITADQGYVVAQIVTNGAPVADALGETSVTFNAVFSGEEGADNSIVATFAKADAWFVDPFVRNEFTTALGTEGVQAAALDEANGVAVFGRSPSAGTSGQVSYSLANLTNDFGKVTTPLHAEAENASLNGEYWGRSIAAVPPFEATIACNYINGYATVLPYEGTWIGENADSYTVQFNMGESGLSVPHLYPVAANKAGTFLYGVDTAGSKIYKFAIVADGQDNTKIGSLQYVASWDFTGGGDLKGMGVGTFNGNDVVYMGKNASRGLWTLDVATDTLTKTGAAIDCEVYDIIVTGQAAGTPRLVVAGGPRVFVYDLAADGSLLVDTPVFMGATTSLFSKFTPVGGEPATTEKARLGVVAVDDETRIVLGTSISTKVTISVVEKKPANLIVRGTFDDGATVEDHTVAFGAAANVTFTAPAGQTITAVTTNGAPADVAAGATSYTYENAALDKYVYVNITAVAPTYTVSWAGSENVVVSNTTAGAEILITSGEFEEGTVITFYPTVGSITNVFLNGAEQRYTTPFVYEVTADAQQVLLVYAGEEPTPAGYNYPEGGAISDAAVVSWLTTKGFTQAQVTALGTNAKLNECYLLNCDISQANAGGSITITGIEVGASGVTVTVSLSRTAGYDGGINGTLKLFGKADLATGDFADTSATVGDAKFASGTSTTATLSGGTAKFFKAVIE